MKTAASLLFAGLSLAQVTSPVAITSISLSGSGCPVSNSPIIISRDGQSAHISLSSFSVGSGPGTVPSNSCTFAVSLQYSSASTTCTATHFSFTYSGTGKVDQRLTGSLHDAFTVQPKGTIGPHLDPVFGWDSNTFGASGQGPWAFASGFAVEVDDIKSTGEEIVLTGTASMDSEVVEGKSGEVKTERIGITIGGTGAC
ncbi:hypothetical protein QBC40DRAFT_276589 [Triangularia verruculosa]|uniref:Uncharacterized protein n=1 Tax=Triangularia verruculosa TaxID=2587418 RepID=A0AAN7AWK1_9PEZI|nr:hypothetical protein QBC40DRAFT_276589 [Triangularia verruculosa]